MAQHFLTLIEYSTIELHPLIIKNNWFLSAKELALALNTSISTIVESLETLTENKHYSYESIRYADNKTTSSILFFSKAGIIRVAYSLKSDDALKFLEFIEDINLQENADKSGHNFYDEIEELLKERLEKIKKDSNTSLEEINHFILTLDNLVKKRKEATTKKGTNSSSMSDILQTVVSMAQSYTQQPKKS